MFTVSLVALLLALPFAADTTAAAGPIGQALTIPALLLVSSLSSLATAATRSIAGSLDTRLGGLDAKITRAIGPALPLVATGYAYLATLASSKLGLTNLPPADVFATAPLAGLLGVVLREVTVKWLAPALGGRKP